MFVVFLGIAGILLVLCMGGNKRAEGQMPDFEPDEPRTPEQMSQMGKAVGTLLLSTVLFLAAILFIVAAALSPA